MKKFLKVLGIILAAIIGILAVVIVVFTVAEYRPQAVETSEIVGEASDKIAPGDKLKLMSWNLGYCALGDNADFFMDGGKMSITSDEARVRSNMQNIYEKLAQEKADIYFLQEIDIASTRSHFIDEVASYREAFEGYQSAFGYNFNVLYMPIPWPPYGHIQSGILTLTDAKISEAQRVALPCPFSWPVSTLNLKRCLVVSRIPLEGTDKELVAVNLHLEAYDDGEGKVAQTKQLAEFLQAEYDKGNYVIAGGDFNQVFSNVDWSMYPVLDKNYWAPGAVEADAFSKDFSLLMDNSNPSCRSLDKVLEGADTKNFQYYLIDGFIVSANVKVETLKTLDYGFKWTDHNPVVMEVELVK